MKFTPEGGAAAGKIFGYPPMQTVHVAIAQGTDMRYLSDSGQECVSHAASLARKINVLSAPQTAGLL